MSDILDQATHTSKMSGILEEAAEAPTDAGVAGLSGKGQMYYDTTKPAVGIHTGDGVWKSIDLTTTSTSTSTTTSTTTSTSTSTS